MTGSDDSSGAWLGRPTRYDLVLVTIPLAFLVGIAATVTLDVSVREAMGVASVLGGIAVVDALFVHSPSAGA